MPSISTIVKINLKEMLHHQLWQLLHQLHQLITAKILLTLKMKTKIASKNLVKWKVILEHGFNL